MRNTIVEGVRAILAFAGLGLLAFSQSSPNEKAAEGHHFQVGRLALGIPLTGLMTITGGTIVYKRDGHLEQTYAKQPRRPPPDYFEVQGRDISEVKGDSAKTFQIKLHNGSSYRFCVLTQQSKCGAPIGPVVEALSAALSAPSAPALEPRDSAVAVADELDLSRIPPQGSRSPFDTGSEVPPRRRFDPIPPPDGHSPAEARLSAPDRQRYTRVPSGGPKVVLTDLQRASLLGALGRYQEEASIYGSLGKSAMQKTSQDMVAVYESMAARGITLALIDYHRSRFSEALSEIDSEIAAGERRSRGMGWSSIAASNLAFNYNLRANIRFAVGDYPGALDDAWAAQDELTEAKSLDRDGSNSSSISQYSENFTKDLVIIHLLQGEQGAGCALFHDKGIHHSDKVVYPNAVTEICGSAALLPPTAPTTARPATLSALVGSGSDEVKAALGQPDRISFPPSLQNADSPEMFWSHGNEQYEV